MKKLYNKLPPKLKDIVPALCILLVMSIIFSIASSKFLSVNNVANIFLQSTNTALVGAGLVFVMISGNIDLSGGSMIALTAVIAGKFLSMGWNPYLVILISLAFGSLVGLFNGFIVTKIGLGPFIATLAVSTMASGLALGISGGMNTYGLPDAFIFWGSGKVGGIAVAVILMIIVYIICHYMMSRTVFGHQVYAVGGNKEAAFLAGVNVDRVQIVSFIIAGFLNGFAGIVMTGRLGTALPTLGEGTEMNALSGLVLGGVSMAGGCGNAIGAFIGCLTIATLNNGLNMMNVSAYWTDFIRGLIILAAIIFDAVRRMGTETN